ncbi:MAG: glycosyl hydrolase 53 family protein [Prevotella sp.]|nr:glycosyl hydrolase 53 family protein [Prevotella sp.]
MKKLRRYIIMLGCALVCAACGGSSDDGDGYVPPVTPEPDEDKPQVQVVERYAGGDISLLTKYETNGAKYLDHSGKPVTDVLTFFKDAGMNAMRVRLFVDPSKASDEDKGQGVCQDLSYVKALGKRIKAAGMKLMVDFHYSDSWADPAKQYTPDAWKDLTDDQLYTKIYEYTKDCLQQLKAAGATPDMIQTGNEISYGMLWGVKGSASLKKCYVNSTANWQRFTSLLIQAGKACREVCPEADIVIHTERAAQSDVMKSFYNKMKAAGVDYDVIGISYYPTWHGNMATLSNTLSMLESNFSDKSIMIVEVGYNHAYQPSDVDFDYSATYPVSDEGQRKFTADLISMLKGHDKVTGLFWWWMEANEYGLDWATKRVTDSWYNASMFDNATGKATSALDEMKHFIR